MKDCVFAGLRAMGLALCALMPAVAVAAPVLDQSSDATGGGFSAGVIVIQSDAQTFTAGISGQLSTVGLMLNRANGSTGSFTLSILDVTAGVPVGTGATLFSQSFDVSLLPLGAFNHTFTDFDISAGGVSVVAGQQYAIAVTYALGTDFLDWLLWDTLSGDPYADGQFFSGDGDLTTVWSPLGQSGVDGGFRTFVDPATVAVPEPATLALLGLGLAGLAATRRSRR